MGVWLSDIFSAEDMAVIYRMTKGGSGGRRVILQKQRQLAAVQRLKQVKVAGLK